MLGHDITYKGRRYHLWASVQKSAEERLRNKRLINIAEVLQTALKGGNDKTQKAYKVICWKSAKVVLCGRRVVTLKRLDDTAPTDGPEKLMSWHQDWHDANLYDTGAQDIIGEVQARLASL